MKFSTLTNLFKTQLPAKVLLSILAVSLCLGTSDRASAIPDSPIPGSTIPTPTTIPTNAPTTTIAPAPAATCANVDVNIQNGTPDTVKVTNFEYLDTTQNAFVPKQLLGASGTRELQSGTVHRATRNFAQVGGRTQFRVTYQHKQGINNFAAPVRVTTDRFVCIDGSTHPVLLDK
ncbi:hypothetical protein [Chamaesiphon sp. OTE_20_metabat_361]|uniref:hypothetical protein n=1 Tax=Chamaesiphon sp. OTE_20_metabat_361 TaxID=2964689 RepID=UPI00286A5666|nr:hypothetical protein [Chamaesiphon sp. OTE_20_metabat_361]